MEPSMMLTGITQPDADRMIARVAAHLPVGASLGRIVGVTDHAIMTRDDSGLETVWSCRDAGCVSRLSFIAGGRFGERTCWERGNCVERDYFRVTPSGRYVVVPDPFVDVSLYGFE
jgi:hypothetical protein